MFKIRKLYIAAFLLVVFFIFTRTYKIETSLLFFNDIGRDFLTLFKWQESGKPPLLGPQTSALPFNQSAIYFYILYPFYLLSGHSPYASLIACTTFYVASLIFGLYALRKYPRLEKSLLLVFLLIIVHPQYIIQGRFIWNPSFVTPCIVTSFYSLIIYLEQKRPQKKLLMLSAFSIALATAFSYSAVPTLIAFAILMLYRRPKQALLYYFYIAISLLILNLPTIVFELRHGFLLTKMMLFGDKVDQGKNYFFAKLNDLNEYTLGTNWFWTIIFLLFFGLFFYLTRAKKTNHFLENSTTLLVSTLLITIVSPVSIHSHYVFGILPLLFLSISFLRTRFIYLTAVFFYIIFLKVGLREDYFAQARHTVAELQACAQSFCQEYQEPLYISNQSSQHPYHNAMEFQYLMSEAGCQVKDINTENSQAKTMAVVLDDGTYEHGKTSYNELTLFGESKEKSRFTCSDTLEIVILEKNK